VKELRLTGVSVTYVTRDKNREVSIGREGRFRRVFENEIGEYDRFFSARMKRVRKAQTTRNTEAALFRT